MPRSFQMIVADRARNRDRAISGARARPIVPLERFGAESGFAIAGHDECLITDASEKLTFELSGYVFDGRRVVLAPAPDPVFVVSRTRRDTGVSMLRPEDRAQVRALKPDGVRYMADGSDRRWDKELQCWILV